MCIVILYVLYIFSSSTVNAYCTHMQTPHVLPWSLQDGYMKERTLNIIRSLSHDACKPCSEGDSNTGM